MKVLLKREPAAGEGNGGGGTVTVDAPPAFTPSASPGMQTEMLRAKPAVPAIQDKPVPESIKGTNFDIDSDEKLGNFDDHKEVSPRTDFSITKTDGKIKTEEKKEETPKQEEKKVEDPKKPTLKIKDATENKQTDKQVEPNKEQQPPKEKIARDYSQFPTEVQEHLKNTSNDAFKFITETFAQKKKLEQEAEVTKAQVKKIEDGGLPFNYYENPDAWRLHPQAKGMLSQASRMENEESFYREQIERITAGEKFQTITAYDQQGRLILSPEMEPSDGAKTELLLLLGRYAAGKTQMYSRLNSFAQSYSGQMKQLNSGIENILAEQFPWAKDEKHEKQKHAKELMELIPQERQGDYLAKLSAYLYAEYQKALELLETKSGIEAQQREEIKTETKRAIEPAVKSASVTGAQKSGVVHGNASNGKYIPPSKFDVEDL